MPQNAATKSLAVTKGHPLSLCGCVSQPILKWNLGSLKISGNGTVC